MIRVSAIRCIGNAKRNLVEEVFLFHMLEYIAWELHDILVGPTHTICAFLSDIG